ncbi:RNA exonuclease 5 [Centruroides vittatus]|uniref:RNA exonuclease 5 n=1 Tax=Centruroides vittatus TaxID=120091 RepID=UPI00350FD8DF
MEKVRKSSKKEKRWESKKRKINAFLQLIESTTSNDMPPENRNCDSLKGNSFSLNKIKTESYIQEQKLLREKLRQAKEMKGPELKLNKDGFNAQLFVYPESGIFRCSSPIFTDDIKQFLMLLTQNNFCSTRWCKVNRCHRISQVILLMVNGLSADHYCQNIDCFPRTKRLPLHLFEVVPPASYGINIVEALCFCPANCRSNFQNVSAANGKIENSEEMVEKTKFRAISKISLLLSPTQMIMEQYPLPFDNSFKDYCFTKVKYKDVCPTSPLYALDCEMVMTAENKLEVARISIVDENLKVIYDTYVLPSAPIRDYLTKFSGITKSTLENVKITLKDVQQNIQELLPPDAILCGQSLNYDFHALKIIHPYVIDTSVIYNLSGARWKKTSLKNLSRKFLGEEIQCSENGHSPIEDSKTTMKLVLLKLKHGLEFGDAVLSSKLNKPSHAFSNPCNPIVPKNGSKCVIGNDLILNWFLRQQIQVVRLMKTETNKQTRKLMRKEMTQHYFTVCLLNVKRDVATDFVSCLEDIDKTINKIYKECAENALFVVATSGCFDETSYRYQNGLCMLKFKTEK